MSDFIMEHAVLLITKKCNLSCRLCSAYIPYTENRYNETLENINATLDKLFQISTYINKFTLTGGEPFLHPNLAEIVEEMRKYHKQIGKIELLTNGTLTPTDDFLRQALKLGSKFYCLIDNYGPNLSKGVESAVEKFEQCHINYKVRNYCAGDIHCGGWINFGELTKRINDEKKTRLVYSKCANPQKMNFNFGIWNGIMSPCGISSRCRELKVMPDNYSEYVNLFDEKLTIEEQRKKIDAIRNTDMLSACAYCTGLCEDSPRYTPAEQLTLEERRCVKNGARNYAEVLEMMKKVHSEE